MVTHTCEVLSVSGRLFIATGTAGQVMEAFRSIQIRAVEISSNGDSEHLLQISDILSFCATVEQIESTTEDCPIIAYLQRYSSYCLAQTIILVGAYLIHRKGFSSEQAINAFQELFQVDPSLHTFEDYLKHGLKAIGCAKAMHWLDRSDDPCNFDIEMSLHYSLPAHGNILALVPSKLLLFPTPAALPPDQSFADIHAPGQQPIRVFSAAYLASVLSDLGVGAVVCLGRTAPGDRDALLAAGIDVHDLDGDGAAMVARTLSVARGAGGSAVAVCSGGRSLPAQALDLGRACLVAEVGFDEGAAAAWVRMACGAAVPGREGGP